MRPKLLFLLLLPMFIPLLLLSQEETQDAEGCHDSPVLTRMPGCTIFQCENKEFDAAELLVAETPEGLQRKKFEGQKESLTYSCPENLSSLQIVRNAENALKKSGFTIVYSGPSDYNNPLVTARKSAQWIEVEGSSSGGYYVTAVRVKEMEQRMEASAEALEAEINASGHVAVYGIQFATAKAALQPESENVLSEVLALLKKNSDWKLRVEGHTDNVGAKEMNLKLSEQRAAAVVAWLVKHGIAEFRLTSQGFGDSQPAADNGTEEGRARNRRVELVKLTALQSRLRK
ncbi:MAG: OmpA family protein [Acidobacteriia bacterium]|nr:OmpA family protein [Terriglobia bacterium]